MRSRILALVGLLAALGLALIGSSPAHAAAPAKPVRVIDGAAVHSFHLAPGERVRVDYPTAAPAAPAMPAVLPSYCFSHLSVTLPAYNASNVVVDGDAMHIDEYFVGNSTGGSISITSLYFDNNSTHQEDIDVDRWYDSVAGSPVFRLVGGALSPGSQDYAWLAQTRYWIFVSHVPVELIRYHWDDQPGTGYTKGGSAPCNAG